jgi:hypothetical protein
MISFIDSRNDHGFEDDCARDGWGRRGLKLLKAAA